MSSRSAETSVAFGGSRDVMSIDFVMYSASVWSAPEPPSLVPVSVSTAVPHALTVSESPESITLRR